jgi:formate-dependent nitrite reductase membrane component NrfD
VELLIFTSGDYDGMPIAITLSKPGKMNKKTTVALLAGVSAGIAIYLISKAIKEKKSNKRKDRNSFARPKKETYAYEYSL